MKIQLLNLNKPKPSTELAISVAQQQVPDCVEFYIGTQKRPLPDLSEWKKHSPCFTERYKQLVNKGVKAIGITNIEPEVFDLISAFVEHGTNFTDDQLQKHAGDLTKFAKRFKMKSLKKICDHFLNKPNFTTSPDAVFNYLSHAHTANAHQLKLKCYEYICDNYPQIDTNTPEWKNAIEKNPKMLQMMFRDMVSTPWYKPHFGPFLAGVICLIGMLCLFVVLLIFIEIQQYSNKGNKLRLQNIF